MDQIRNMIAKSRKRLLGLLGENSAGIEEQFLEEKAADGSKEFVKSQDNFDRAFYKELVEVVEASDVILEVLDARGPLGTRCADMEKMVLDSRPNKKLRLLLNKLDLVPCEAVEKLLKYLREELPAVAFKCSTQEQRLNLSWKSSKASKCSNLLQTSDCLGAETLIKLLKTYSRSHNIKKSITVGIVGLLNVGKSSLINTMKRCHVVNVGATPGLTRSMQEVELDKNVKLLDFPGVVMLRSAQNDLAVDLRNGKIIEKLEDPAVLVNEILKLCPAKLLSMEFNVVEVYGAKSSFIGSLKSVDDFQVSANSPVKFSEHMLEGSPVQERKRMNSNDEDEVMTSEEEDKGKIKSKSSLKLYEVQQAEQKRRKKVITSGGWEDWI